MHFCCSSSTQKLDSLEGFLSATLAREANLRARRTARRFRLVPVRSRARRSNPSRVHTALRNPPLALRNPPLALSRALASPERVGLRIVIIESSLSRTATLFSTRNAARTQFVFFSTAYRIARARTARQSSPLIRRKEITADPSRADATRASIHPPSLFPRVFLRAALARTNAFYFSPIHRTHSRTSTDTRAPLTDARKLMHDALMTRRHRKVTTAARRASADVHRWGLGE